MKIDFINGSSIKTINSFEKNMRSMRGNAQLLALRTGMSLESCYFAIAQAKNDYEVALTSLQEANVGDR